MYRAAAFFDQALQWIGIRAVYQYEYLLLPLAVLLFVVVPDRRWWRLVKYAAFFLFAVLYLAFFEMHWHSAIAWPLSVAAICYVYTRGHWIQVVATGPRWPDGWPRPGQLLRRRGVLPQLVGVSLVAAPLAFFLPFSWFALIAAASLLIAIRRGYRTSGAVIGAWLAARLALWLIPLTSWLVLAAVFALILLLLWALSWIRGGETLLSLYLRADPRMVRYLTCIRLLKARGSATILANQRLTDPTGPLSPEDRAVLRPKWRFWTLLFAVASLPVVRHVLRGVLWFFGELLRLPTVDSRFVTDGLRRERERIWCQYQRLRFGDSLDDYVAYVQGRSPLPAERNAGEIDGERAPRGGKNARRMRLRWLALTEALAECECFSSPVGAPEPAEQPDLLRAADLLGGAAELQHELADDLSQYHDRGRQIRELRLAMHFFDRSACCLEACLEWPGSARPAAPSVTAVPERTRRFCGPLLEEAWWRASNDLADQQRMPDAAAVPRRLAAEGHLRLALLWRYLLIAQFQWQCDMPEVGAADATDTGEHPLGTWLAGDVVDMLRRLTPLQRRYSLPRENEATLAQLAAYVSWTLGGEHVARARTMLAQLQTSGTGGRDPLLLFAELLQDTEQEERAESRQFWMLCGRLSEHDMKRNPRGSRLWSVRCREAAAYYGQAGSLRAWRLYAQTLDPDGPGNGGNHARPA
jgi:hypothetical protein